MTSRTHRRLKLAWLPTSLAVTLAALPSISEIPSLDSGMSSTDYQLMSNVSHEKSFNSGCVIRSTRQCSSNRLSEMSGSCESEITIALLRRNTAISSSGFGSAPTKNTTTSSGNGGSRLATQASSRRNRRLPLPRCRRPIAEVTSGK